MANTSFADLVSKLAAGNGLPAINRTAFLPNPGGTGGGGGAPGGGPSLTGVVILPGSGGSGSSTTTTGTTTVAGGCQPSIYNLYCLFSGSAGVIGNQLLRIVFLLLGLIAIIGAIYLYKPTSGLITGPIKAIKGTVKAIAESAAQGEE